MRYAAIDTGAGATVAHALSAWEALAVAAVGNVIEFWNFKRNHGRVWALLYLRAVPMTAGELQEVLELSKGAVSMLVRELEQHHVLTRTRSSADDAQQYVANSDLLGMIGKVIAARESGLVASVRRDLEAAEAGARTAGAPRDVVDRLRRMRQVSALVDRALRLFLTTARLDLGGARELLSMRSPPPR